MPTPALAALPENSAPHSQRLVDALSLDIIAGRLAPGSRLDERRLAERFDVSRTPVREALRQLAMTGLAEARPRRGVFVTNINAADLAMMFEAMVEMEALCARIAAQRMSALERRQVEVAQTACRSAAEAGDVTAYRAANTAFHERVYRGTHNKYLAATAASFRQRLAPFRDTQIHFDDRPRASAHEHEGVVAALLAQDADAAQAAMQAHEVSSSLHAMGYLAASRE